MRFQISPDVPRRRRHCVLYEGAKRLGSADILALDKPGFQPCEDVNIEVKKKGIPDRLRVGNQDISVMNAKLLDEGDILMIMFVVSVTDIEVTGVDMSG